MVQGQCSSCEADAKYRCPGCSALSCSLQCVNRHKAATSCSGKRDPAAFRTVAQFDDRALASDYRFLEGALRTVDGALRGATY